MMNMPNRKGTTCLQEKKKKSQHLLFTSRECCARAHQKGTDATVTASICRSGMRCSYQGSSRKVAHRLKPGCVHKGISQLGVQYGPLSCSEQWVYKLICRAAFAY